MFKNWATRIAPGGISVQIPAGEFRSQIATLSQQPGMGYLNELTQRNDVNWQPVKLAHDQWDFKQEGLTPAGAALVAVAVAWAMPAGAGAGLLKTTGATTSAMANAAFASLAAQASITLINNKGDVGKTLKELGSSQTVKATIAAALTAGVLDKIGGTSTMRNLSRQTGFSEKLTYNLINASGRALTNTAINGGNLEDALRQALIGGLVDTAHGQVASKIGQASIEYVSHKLTHALAGCVAGAAAEGLAKTVPLAGLWVKSWPRCSRAEHRLGMPQRPNGRHLMRREHNARMAVRTQAAQQGMQSPQFWLYQRAQSLQRAITESGGSLPGNMTAPGARINYT